MFCYLKIPSFNIYDGPASVYLSPSTTSYTVTEGDTLTAITCYAYCNPSCSYTWSRSGSTVSYTATLSLGQADRGEAGSYVCKARNTGSGVSKNGPGVSVTVRYGPDSVFRSPSTISYTVTEGHTLSAITCYAYCNPTCTYTWSRSGSTVSYTATLNLGQAVRGDAGSYTCQARNMALGRSKNGSAVSVSVRYGPENMYLSPSTTSYTVTEGHTLSTIRCYATCNPSCTYTWSRSGSTVSSTATLSLGQADRGEAGSYVCKARNTGSGVSKNGPTVSVNVRYGPENMYLSPSTTSYTVTEGHTLSTIRCYATCNPSCTYTWSRSGSTVSSTATLSLGQADRGDAGSYVCKARNTGSGVSKNGPTVSVTVRYGPGIVSLSPSTTSYTVTEGDTLTSITCFATCNPSCSYTWSRSGSTVSSTATLNLGQAVRGEAGSYVCTARNTGSGVSNNGPEVSVTVRDSPYNVSLSPPTTSYTVTEGNTIPAITCSAICYPACTYTWSRSGVTVSSTATLNLHQAVRGEAGSYVCQARNPLSGRSKNGPTLSITVRYGPGIVSLSPSTTSYTVTEGDTLTSITCYATCYPSCSYTWSRSGSTVSSTATLNLGQAVRGEAGSYVCTARNTGSGVSNNGSEVSVTVRDSPYIVSLSPPTTSYTVTEGNTIPAITCSAICYPACTYTWSRSGVTVSSTATLNLHQAARGEAGSYVCQARNPLSGRSKNGPTLSVTVRYGPENVSFSPTQTSYTVTEGDTIKAITCSATCYPCTYTWSISGVTVSSTATLNLGQAERGEAGSYVCRARNSGSGISRSGPSVIVTIRYGPDTVSLSPSTTSYTVTEGNTIPAITCSAICYPACTYTWSRSGVTVSSTAKLDLGQAERAEAGSYMCQARNPGSGRSKNGPTVNVSVKCITEQKFTPVVFVDAPDVAIIQSTNLLLENTPLDLLCKASGVPAVYNFTDFVQRVGDVVVLNSHIESPGVMDSISVNISSLQLQDTGIYTCYVHNEITGLNKQLIQTASQRIDVLAENV
ncbi:carcinoembryonic antigen-related cell adhesion molecule 5-like [Mya arenaria]|uniref:carcinoembryonic antigen-related cell adhesion molecule 5-like n=1 Tax=Mya arenaria TaxID=6604 RepID=UPI0022DEFFFF|nr:carcinoembryonic antigen-related cell adhesion molecule 5-like [Mya arenaria]